MLANLAHAHLRKTGIHPLARCMCRSETTSTRVDRLKWPMLQPAYTTCQGFPTGGIDRDRGASKGACSQQQSVAQGKAPCPPPTQISMLSTRLRKCLVASTRQQAARYTCIPGGKPVSASRPRTSFFHLCLSHQKAICSLCVDVCWCHPRFMAVARQMHHYSSRN
jgi:hypothetical protein